jgi:hypothetical protein
MFKRIKIWWEFEGRYLPSEFFKGLRNLLTWFSIIWNDRDYDDHYIWEILKFKLKKHSKYTKLKDRHLSSHRDSEIISLCANLIDKIQHETYLYEFLDYQELDTQFIEIEDNPELYEMKSHLLWENFDDLFKKYPNVYRKIAKPGMQKEEIAKEICHYNHKRAKSMLFKILESNIESWWS